MLVACCATAVVTAVDCCIAQHITAEYHREKCAVATPVAALPDTSVSPISTSPPDAAPRYGALVHPADIFRTFSLIVSYTKYSALVDCCAAWCIAVSAERSSLVGLCAITSSNAASPLQNPLFAGRDHCRITALGCCFSKCPAIAPIAHCLASVDC